MKRKIIQLIFVPILDVFTKNGEGEAPNQLLGLDNEGVIWQYNSIQGIWGIYSHGDFLPEDLQEIESYEKDERTMKKPYPIEEIVSKLELNTP